ncbi:hypothetical protein ACX1N5_01565 [Acinetobacter sp. ANC 4636]
MFTVDYIKNLLNPLGLGLIVPFIYIFFKCYEKVKEVGFLQDIQNLILFFNKNSKKEKFLKDCLVEDTFSDEEKKLINRQLKVIKLQKILEIDVRDIDILKDLCKCSNPYRASYWYNNSYSLIKFNRNNKKFEFRKEPTDKKINCMKNIGFTLYALLSLLGFYVMYVVSEIKIKPVTIGTIIFKFFLCAVVFSIILFISYQTLKFFMKYSHAKWLIEMDRLD